METKQKIKKYLKIGLIAIITIALAISALRVYKSLDTDVWILGNPNKVRVIVK